MITPIVRFLLVLGSFTMVAFMLRRIRHSKMQIHDSIFWLLFSILLLALSIFPEIAIWAAFFLGIESPINIVFLIVIFCLIVQLFSSTVRVSLLDARIKTLTQQMAVEKKLREEADEALAMNKCKNAFVHDEASDLHGG